VRARARRKRRAGARGSAAATAQGILIVIIGHATTASSFIIASSITSPFTRHATAVSADTAYVTTDADACRPSPPSPRRFSLRCHYAAIDATYAFAELLFTLLRHYHLLLRH